MENSEIDHEIYIINSQDEIGGKWVSFLKKKNGVSIKVLQRD